MPPREPAPFWEMMDAAERALLVNAWERRFLAGIRAQIDERDDPWLTEDQSRVLAVIALKAGVALPDEVRDLLDDRPGLLMAFAVGTLGDPRLTAWEDGFLRSLVATGAICRPLSDKQSAVLDKIAGKVREPLPAIG